MRIAEIDTVDVTGADVVMGCAVDYSHITGAACKHCGKRMRAYFSQVVDGRRVRYHKCRTKGCEGFGRSVKSVQ